MFRDVRPSSQERKISPKRKFWDGYPCGHPAENFSQALQSADRKKASGKGPRQNVKNRQKASKMFSTLFVIFRAGQKTSKIVKKCQKYFRHFSTIFARHQLSGPFWGALIQVLEKEAFWHGHQARMENFGLKGFGLIFRSLSGPKKQPKHKVFGRDIPGISETQTSGYPGQKLYASGLFSVVLDREWPGCPRIWVGTSRIWKNFTQENFGLIFRTLP